MPLWFRKIIVVFITILTLGLVHPTSFLTPDVAKTPPRSDRINQNKEQNKKEISYVYEDKVKPYKYNSWQDLNEVVPFDERSNMFVDFTVYQAMKQSNEKFGPKISSKIGDQFKDQILPSIEDALKEFSSSIDEETYDYLVISDQPSSGYGEKIFHIYDGRTNTDLFRLHVSRESLPREGHWFTFHYHKADDHYIEHHPLGKLYWDKNTPPKWNMYS